MTITSEVHDDRATTLALLQGINPLSPEVTRTLDRLYARIELLTIQRDAARSLATSLLLDEISDDDPIGVVDPVRQAEIRRLFDAAPSLDALLAAAEGLTDPSEATGKP